MARVPLSTLKAEVKTLLDNANTTTGSPIDLSDGLTTRVGKVLQINIESMPVHPQPSFFPCITMFYDGKEIEPQDICRDALTGKFKSEIDLKIVGIVWVDDMNSTDFNFKDLADNECEQLMENIEQVLRLDPTLGGNAEYSRSTAVGYHSYPVGEGAHLRAGLLNYRIRVRY